MKNILLISALVLSVLSANALTNIAGGDVSGTWTTAGSPYNINGNITIQDEDVLTIQPGVEVNFQGHYYLRLIGQLVAEGTNASQITFTASNTTNGWRGIIIDNTDGVNFGVNGAMDDNGQSKLIYCNFLYGRTLFTDTEKFNGGALFIKGFSNIIVNNCSFTNCSVVNQGGAIFWGGETDGISITNCSFNNVEAGNHGGAIKIEEECQNILLQNNAFTTCESGGNGGAVSIAYECSVINILNNSFTNILSHDKGGGIFIAENSENILINGNNLMNTSAALHGGGLFFGQDCNGVTIKNNELETCLAGGHGGGIHLGQNCLNVQISNNTIKKCESGINGGGVHIANQCQDYMVSGNRFFNNEAEDKGGGLFIGYYADISVIDNEFSNNNADERGGAIFLGEVSTILLNNALVVNNSSGTGGGIFFGEDILGTITNVTIANNLAQFAGGLFTGKATTDHVTISNSIIWGNAANVAGDNILGGYCGGANDYTNPAITGSDIEGGQAGILFFTADPKFFSGIPTLTLTDTENGHVGTYSNNINENPQFVEPTAGPGGAFDGTAALWSVRVSSPCRTTDSVMGYMGAGAIIPISFAAILGAFGLIGLARFFRRRKKTA
ncbi:MAG: right-handed parallel beta-helix repeat-containing protein [Prolixibacteraceae bacterium]|nr:right-handed parallel beta-helix repeat-containing protein [Prolixibacteraceae bacterium]